MAKSGTSPARANKPQQSRTRRFGVERARQAQPQDLREIVVKLHGRAQDFGILHPQNAQRPRFVEHTRGRRVENIGTLMSVNELQILRNELNIDQPAGDIFEIPALAVTFFLRNGRSHLHNVAGRHWASRGRRKISRTAPSTRCLNAGEDETTRARVNAICSQVQASVSW